MAKIVHAIANCRGQCGGVFKCPGCERWVGWCCGCSDDMPELCDDCRRDVTEWRELLKEAS